MSEAAPEATQDGNSGATSTATEFQPITSQDDLNRIIAERVGRERAKYADYKDVKAKAEQLDVLTEASKSELEKATERIASLEGEIKAAQLGAGIAGLAREFELTDKQAAALKYAPDLEAAREIAEGLATETSDRRTSGPLARREGQTITRPDGSGDAAFARALFSQGD